MPSTSTSAPGRVDAKKHRKQSRARVARQRQRLAKAGGKQLATLISPDAAGALERIQAQHGSVRAAVEAALIAHAKTI